MKSLSRRRLRLQLSMIQRETARPFCPDSTFAHHLLLSEDASDDVISATFQAFCDAVDATSPLIVFPDGVSGWRASNRLRKHRALIVNSASEVLDAILRRSYFRTRYFENYYGFDAGGAWFVLFCHDDDLHFWLRPSAYASPAVRQWQASFPLSEMP
jgi:hypothetical protein